MTKLRFLSRDNTMTMRRALEVGETRRTISTGSATLDVLVDGGLRTGEVVEVFGGSNTGKTQLGMQAAISSYAQGSTTAFVDTEGQFRPERLASICKARALDPDPILRSVFAIRAESVSRQASATTGIRDDPALENCKLVVIDTLSKNFSLEYPGAKATGQRQTVLGAYLNATARFAFMEDWAVLLLNRVASVGTEGAEREVDVGGETVRHFCQKVVHLRRSGDFVMASRADLLGPEVRLRIGEGGLV